MLLQKKFQKILFVTELLFLVSMPSFSQLVSLGLFEAHADIGQALHQGSAAYNSPSGEYELSINGTNSEGNKEKFHFMWKRMKGDFILYTHARFAKEEAPVDGRLGWMVRSSLGDNSANINAFANGEGETSMEFRRTAGDTTSEIHSKLRHADVIQLQREGDTYTMRAAKFGEPFVTEQVTDLKLGDELYVGVFIGSGNKNITQKGIFSNIRITIPVPKILALYRTDIGSHLEILDIETGNRKIIYSDSNSVHAPIWKKDGKSLIYGKQGGLYTIDVDNNLPQPLFTGEIKNNSNDHVLSFDGKMLAFCAQVKERGGPIIYTVPVTGGKPKRINRTGPSYPHSWSPDGETLLFSGSRKGEFEIYKVPATGGKEFGITNVPGMDDCPEYTPDGQYIYFNSNRTGSMRIWRMKADGSDPEVVTTGEFHDWFPHISPDGKWIVFLSYSKDEVSASGHPSYKHVYLRLMPVSGGQPKVIAYLYGGQGSINSPCWSSDSKKIAFASYTDVQY